MKKLAIVSPNKFKYSETFIHAHIRELPFDKVLLHGGYLPTFASPIPPIDPSSPSSTNSQTGIYDLSQIPDKALAYAPWYRTKLTERDKISGGLQRFLKQNQVEVVLAEYGPSGVEVAPVCKRLSIPLIVHFHGYDAYRDDILGDQGRFYPEMCLVASALVVVSEDMRRQLISLGAPKEKIHLIPYGVDPILFQPTQPDKNPLDLVGIGRFTAKKAPQLTIQAFARIAGQFPEARLLIAGIGDLHEECKLLTQSLELQDRVLFPGRLNPGEVAKLLSDARGFVQHSLRPENGDSEGLPLAVLEAMATSLPIVATHHAGIPDAVRHEKEGLLCEEGDVEGMAKNMARILEDGELAVRMGKAGRARIEEYYNKERYLAELTELLENS